MAEKWWEQDPIASGEDAQDGDAWWADDPIVNERKKRKSQATAADYLHAIDSGLAQGVAGIAGGIGTFIQDPAANALAGVSGAAAAADRGITWAANAISGKDIAKENEAVQENARLASRFAAESRDAQVADPSNLPARFGRMLQRDSERAKAEILASDKANNPELIAQQQNTAEAQGFVDNLAAIKDNPLAFAHTMARSAPDMAAGVGVGSVVHRAGASLGRVSTAGALSEASSSALQSRQGVYQQVNEMPLEMLAKSPRFQAVLAETQGDPAKAREILANELADQVPLLAGAGTALGTVLTNKLFGGDATAKTIAGVERMGIREFGKRVAQDTVEEGFQGVPEDAVQYGASVQADPSQQYDPGGSAAQNLAAGFAMGSGGHGLGYARDNFRGSNVQNQTPAENQQNQAPALSGQAQAATNSGAAAGVVAGRGSAGLEAVGVGDTAAAEEALKTPVQLTALDRADALGGELQAITERQQELAPENGYGPAFDGERQDLATKAAELAAERESIASTWPKAERGAMSSFTTEAGARLEAQYALMDAGDLVTSHDEGLAVNPLFPKELQPRDRSRQASELQVSGIVQRLDPARLGLSADAANGAPIVGADGLVESGNARTIALKRVYQANGQKAENYKQFLRDNAAQFGLAPEAIDAMAKPVLVRVRATPVNRAEFARQANASTVQRMSPSEQALSDAKRLNSLDGLNPDEQGDFGNNMDFVRQFMATLPVTEQSDLIESDGRLSTAGYRRIQNAVLARAYGDSPSLRRMTESMDNNLANISKALVRVAPTIAAARERMDAGTLHQADIAPDLLAAVEGLSALKEKGWKVSDELGQADLTGPKYSPEAAELLTFLSENARSPRRIAEFFQRYYDALEHAGDPTQPSMFGDDGPAPTRASLINTAKETQNGNADQDPQRGVAGEGAQADARDGGQPQDAPRSEGRDQGNGPTQADAAGRQPGKPAREAANDEVGEWVHFPEDSGTLGIPRSDMPQVKGEHRGALVNFLNARGISSTKDEVPASSLKPTQAEFSREKTERFMKTGSIGERSVLVSSDGHVLDGHHQWMAMKALGESVPVIRLDAPIRELLDAVREFPSVQQSEGDKTPVGQRAAAVQDFKDALGDLAQIASKHTRAAMVPEKTPDLMPTLAKLFDAAIRLVGTDMKRATKWVREQIKADPRFKTFWNKISPELYQKAALQALDGMANPAQHGLFGDIGEAASAVQGDLFNSPAKATEATSAVSKIESKAYDRDRDNYRPPSAKTFLPAELIARANGYIEKYSKQPRPMVVSPKDRARAKAELKPLLDAALGAFQGFAKNVAAVAQQSGALGQIVASVKNMDRAVEKYVDPDGADFSPERMRDLLRATVVVSSYGDVQAVVDAVVKVFGSVARVKTRISEDARIDGYADVLLNVVLPDGVAAEIQINVPQMLAAKDAQGHKLYEAQRVQPEASAAYKEIGDAMREFYDAAFAAAGNKLTLPVAENSRQPRAQLKKTASEIGAADLAGSDLAGSDLAGNKSEPLSSSLKTLPSGNLTNSSPLNDATNSQPGGNLSGTFIGTPPASILRADAKNSEPEPAGVVRTATQIATDIAKAQPDGDVAALREQARDAIVAELGRQALDAMEPGSFMRADGLTQAIHDGQYEALREFAAAMPVPVRESDIPRDAATQAYSGTSHSPEQRGASARRNYVRALVDAWKRTEAALGDDAAARARAVEVLGDVVEGYRSRYLEALGASARVMSSMIAGPARFPAEANRKKSETADKRAQEASEFLRKGIARMAKAARGPIDNSPDSEVARIRANLEEREATQERMKAVNAALRKKDDEPLVALGYSPALIAELKKPDFAGRRGYADYKLANNNAEIRRLRERLAQAEQRVAEAAAGPVATARQGVRTEENAQDDRLRLFFDEKPGEAVRSDLKANGFKWSPNAGAWQRQLTANARAAAERVLNKHFPQNSEGGIENEGGRDVYEKAEASGETKLTYEQWVQVRTPAFRSWFGDWEAVQAEDPEVAAESVSKVVDPDTGEPAVVYHETKSDFSTFRDDKPIFVAFSQTGARVAALSSGKTMELFARAESPLNSPDTPVHFLDVAKALRDNPSADSVYVEDEAGISLALRNKHQLKSATGNRGTFDTANPDIRLSRSEPPNGDENKGAPASGSFQPRLTGLPGEQRRGQILAKTELGPLSRGDGEPAGMPVAELQALADRIAAKNPRMPKVHVLADPTLAPEGLRDYIEEQGAWNDVDGAMHEGEFYLFASGLPDALRAEHVLAEHEAAHFGLHAILGDAKTQAMSLIYANNGAVRKAATALQKRGKLTNAEAVEEVIVDIPSAQLAQLKGWRKVTALARDWLAEHGFTAMAAKLSTWLDGTLSEQQRADLFVADLVRGARAYMAGKAGASDGAKAAGTRLSAALADDQARQEKRLQTEARERGYRDAEDLAARNPKVYELVAKRLGIQRPGEAMLSRGMAGDQTESAAFKRWFGDSKVVDAVGKPLVVYHGTTYDFSTFRDSLVPEDQQGQYFTTNPRFASDYANTGDDGGNVIPAYLTATHPYEIQDDDWQVGLERNGKLTPAEARRAGHDAYVIRGMEGGDTWIVFRPEQIKSATGNRGTFDPTNPDIRLSRAAPAQDAATRAEAIIQDRTGGVRPLDAIAQGLTRGTGVERLTGAIYDKAASLLDAVVPEKVKAGVMSDYGLPEAVKDQRTMLQGRQRVQLRKAGSLIEKLATLTRAESRVAYEWMNMDGADPQAYVSMMQGLPEESVAVLQEVQEMIDRLSKDAVRLGQLDPEAFKRNRFAYLRRSYAKHTLEQTKGQKAKRARTIAVLGEQYKGRGLSETAAMSAIKSAAPDWWQRKLAKGKADAALKGEQLLRLERRAPSGTGTTPLPGMTGRQPGRVLELAYWPASERLPAKYADWTQAGTWEVRDVKGPNAVLWRDFTKDEREQMGEIDEARFAIAKTLHAMIHDVEVGRYLDWLAINHAKKEGEAIPGEVVDASEKYRDTFAPGEWVRVPDSKIAGTNVLKYGKLAGRYVEGPVWNDLRQMAGGGFQPFGDTYNKVLNLWKTSKTALSPAVHMNNVMSNFVMADWHEVHAAHVSKALRIMLAASDKRGGIADRDAAREILNRYSDSGGDSGSWVTNEISRDQIEPLLASLEREMAATNGGNAETQTGVFAALQHALHLRFPAAFDAAAVSLPGKAVKVAGGALLDAYQAEDDVFRLGAWLAAKEQGATDLDAGKRAKASFLDYNINAPWINAMRKSAWPFLSFTYRAVPMLLETVARKPHKLLKLMALAGGLNALGVMLAGAGGGDEDERKLLPEEKAGNVWGMVPKLIRMPWNDGHNSPVYLDIRRFIPVGDVFDIGQGQSAIPILPGLQPGGPLAVMAEVALNKSAFTGKPITLGTDTARQKAEKFLDHMYKAAAPNVLGVPGTYATTGVVGSLTGRTDAFGREMSTAQAVASSFGVKLGSYPPDVMRRNLMGKFGAEKMEIDKNISQYKRQLQTGRIGQEEFQRLTAIEQDKKRKLQHELNMKLN